MKNDTEMTVYLHIGLEKTGTTSIQEFLRLNRGPLLERGTLYPVSCGELTSQDFVVAMYSGWRNDDATIVRGLRDEVDFAAFRDRVLSSLRKEIDESGCRSIVLSSEHFQSRLSELAEIRQLHRQVESLGWTNLKVIVYLRRPASLAESLFSTAIRNGFTYAVPPGPIEYGTRVFFHRETVELWSEVFGKENLILRVYEQKEFFQGDLVADFCQQINLTATDFPRVDSYNSALSRTGLHLLKMLNETIPVLRDGQINVHRGNLVQYIDRHFNFPRYRMPKSIARLYDEYFAESDEWVRANFFPHRKTLFNYDYDQFSDDNEPMVLGELDLIRVRDLITDVWLRFNDG